MRLVADMARIERRAMMVERPQPAGELVGHPDGSLVVALSLLQVQCPGLQWIERMPRTLPHYRRAQHRTPTVYQQCADVGIAAFGDRTQSPLSSR